MVSVVMLVVLVIALFVSPATTSMGVVMKVYTVFVNLLTLFMFIYNQMKDKMVG